MTHVFRGLWALIFVTALGLAALAPVSADSSPGKRDSAQLAKHDDLPNPLEEKRRGLREEAVTSVLNGEATPQQRNGSTVVKVGEGATTPMAAARSNPKASPALKRKARNAAKADQYVELEQQRSDKVFVILADFGKKRHPDYPDRDTDPDVPGPERFDGPARNTIPRPDRSEDNSTVWKKNFDRKYFQDLYFKDDGKSESVKRYYETQSSGRYTIDGQVQDWVRVPYNTARYGREDATTWDFIRDAMKAWVEDQKAKGKTDAEIKQTLSEYDQWDRYDYDGDGDFNEPDGYIDRFQIVHAGSGEEDGSSLYGEDAIWSHRWYAFLGDVGVTGPENNQLGGTEIPGTDMWIGDYTVQPENGGRSVFAHEYAHDLGLPDAYSTSPRGGDNSNEYWTLLAQSRLNAKGEALGERAGDLGAWEKLQMGWLDYEVVRYDQRKTLDLGPQEYNTAKPQGAVMTLPKKPVEQKNGPPASGQKQFYSGSGNDLSNTMTTDLKLASLTGATLTAKVRYEIETGYDYAYIQASRDNGKTWKSLDGTIDGKPLGRDSGDTPAIDGAQKEWADLEVSLEDYDDSDIELRFLYRTDGATVEKGLFIDDIKVSAGDRVVIDDGAETDGKDWRFDGFSVVGESSQIEYNNYYVMGNRSYVSHDKYLKTGPYNFGHLNTKPKWAERYSYGKGLLISYWDTSQSDNNTIDHPGEGRNLPIDANPEPITNIVTGEPWRPRIQVYDAPFSTTKAPSMTLHTNGEPSYIRAQGPSPLFDDSKKYWFGELPTHGVKVPKNGVKIRVLSQQGTSARVKFN